MECASSVVTATFNRVNLVMECLEGEMDVETGGYVNIFRTTDVTGCAWKCEKA